MYDVIIIGAGPAGLTAALYLRRANKNVLVLEQLSYGGQIVNTPKIENYPACPNISGFDFANNLYEQVKEYGAEFRFEKVLAIKNSKIKKVCTNKNTYLAKSIIISTGCQNRKLGIPFEDNYLGKGISYCATCDGNFYRGKVVAVLGGGNTACDDALYLSDIAKDVYLIHRRDTFRADDKTIAALREKENVHFVLNSNVIKLNGTNKLESIEVKNSQEIKKLMIDGLFIAIGQDPSTEIFKEILSLDDKGYIKTKKTHTNHKGIFAAGDVCQKDLRQLVTATSDGAMAAMETLKYLNN